MATKAETAPLCLNVFDRTVIGRNRQCHRHQEFVRFLSAIEAEVQAAKAQSRHPRQLRRSQAPKLIDSHAARSQ
jgi:hypothetical protein